MYSLTFQKDRTENTPVTTPILAFQYLMRHCFDPSEMWREKTYALFLDKARRPVGHILVSVGGFDKTVFDRKLVLKTALKAGAYGIIISHNHPSGDPKPSVNDIEVTKVIKRGCNVLDLELVDHVIICEKEFFSFQQETVQKVTDKIRPNPVKDALQVLLSVYPQIDRAASYAALNPKKTDPGTREALVKIQEILKPHLTPQRV